jgi:hypothetical protein
VARAEQPGADVKEQKRQGSLFCKHVGWTDDRKSNISEQLSLLNVGVRKRTPTYELITYYSQQKAAQFWASFPKEQGQRTQDGQSITAWRGGQRTTRLKKGPGSNYFDEALFFVRWCLQNHPSLAPFFCSKVSRTVLKTSFLW